MLGCLYPVMGTTVFRMDINQATARAISAERAIAGLTVRDLSAKSGIPMSTLMRILGAEREIKISQIELLASAFGIYPHEIVEQAEVIMERAARPVNAVPVLRVAERLSAADHTLAARDDDDDEEAATH